MPSTPKSKPLYVAITGSERGIGQAIAQELCRRGHFYYGLSRFNDVDVSDYECVRREFEELADQPLDALVNNAGIAELGTVFELSPEAWRRQMATNLDGVFYCTKEYARAVKGRGGKIINIASTAGMSARPGRSAYAASKAAVISFSLSMTEELRPYGIRVYCVAPGACNTDFRRRYKPDDDFEHMMQPMELARLVVDLIENGELLDGQVLTADKRR